GRAAAARTDRLLCSRILLTVVVIFRILIVAIVGETVYDDEQTMFVCNTLQPGCNQACYDQAFPISHIRYWVFQIIMVCTPSLCFITYSVHQSAKQRERRTTKSKMRRQEGISRFYIIQVVFRNALEIGFLVGQYFLYGFNVPSMYECDRYPCIKEVECYVSRPTEKTV
ncbi:CXD2 protein, partial [Chauna torquata]|nr:CXD2 protein [Chauna torquata]